MPRAMPLDQSRIQGFGSDGAKRKTYSCPAGHLLQPWKAVPGACDGCKKRVMKGDWVMDCRPCNWYLCQECHPQEKEQAGWLWGSVEYLVEKGKEEVGDIAADLDAFAGGGSLFAGCTTVDTAPDLEIDYTKPAGTAPLKGQKQKPPGAGQGDDPEHGEQRDGESEGEPGAQQAKGAQGAEAKSTAVQALEAPAHKVPAKDVLDFGQHDLLDLQPEPVVKKAPAGGAGVDLLGLEGGAVDGFAFPGQVGSPPAAAQGKELKGFFVDLTAAPPLAALPALQPM